MKKFLVLMLISASLFSCKKENESPYQVQVVSGTPYFSDPAADGTGFTFVTEDGELLLFSDLRDLGLLHDTYQDILGKHCWLIYADTGHRGCGITMIGPCREQYRIVEIRKLTEY